MNRPLLTATAASVLILFSSSVFAVFRCNGRLVNGFSKLDLLSACGEPVYRDSYTRSDGSGSQPGGVSCETVDQWYYVDPETHYNYEIDIERGFVTSVNRGQFNDQTGK